MSFKGLFLILWVTIPANQAYFIKCLLFNNLECFFDVKRSKTKRFKTKIDLFCAFKLVLLVK